MNSDRFSIAWQPGTIAFSLAVVIGVAEPELLSFHAGLLHLQFLSYALFAIGMVISVRQIRQLQSERRRLDELESSGGRAAPPEESDTSVVFRRWRAFDRALTIGAFPESFRSEQRREAIEATSAAGSAQRFLSSALIVITVLGTFIGVKSALPQLQSAVTGAPELAVFNEAVATPPPADPGGAGDQSDSMGPALNAIEGAFGANLAALLGALVLSSFAFGLRRGRAEFLRAIEQVSERMLYSRIPAGGDISQIVQAVTALRSTVGGLNRIESSIDGLNAQLVSFAGSLDAAVNRMGSEVGAALASSSLERESRIERQLTELVGTVKLTAAALDRTAVAYAGLVKGLESQELDVRSVAASVNTAAERLASISDPVAKAAASIAEAQSAFASATKGSAQALLDQALTAKSILASALEAMEAGNHSTITWMQAVSKQNQRAFDSVVDSQREILERATQEREAIQGIPEALVKLDLALQRFTEQTATSSLAIGSEVAGVRGELRDIETRVAASTSDVLAVVHSLGEEVRRQSSPPAEGAGL